MVLLLFPNVPFSIASRMNSSEDVIEFSSEEDELMNSFPVNKISVEEEDVDQTPNVVSNNYDNVKFGKDLLAIPFTLMMENFKTRPKEKMLWGNIKENSVGLIVGPSGAGKSIMSENLAMSLASGYNNYLGLPILSEGGKVILSISLEESCNPRTERNIKQIERVIEEKGKEWMNRWYVIDERMPQFLTTDQEFGILHDLIETIKPDVLIIDSLTHLCNGQIEDSTVCSKLMKRVRGLAKGGNCTPIVIHHIPKINDAPFVKEPGICLEISDITFFLIILIRSV